MTDFYIRKCSFKIVGPIHDYDNKKVIFEFEDGTVLEQKYDHKKGKNYYWMCSNGLICNNTTNGGDCWGWTGCESCGHSQGYGTYCTEHDHRLCLCCGMLECGCCAWHYPKNNLCPRCNTNSWIRETKIPKKYLEYHQNEYHLLFDSMVPCECDCGSCDKEIAIYECCLCDTLLCRKCKHEYMWDDTNDEKYCCNNCYYL